MYLMFKWLQRKTGRTGESNEHSAKVWSQARPPVSSKYKQEQNFSIFTYFKIQKL